MKNIYVNLSDMLKKQEPLVLATIIETIGSSPQVPGASAIFSTEGLIEGTLGGGPLEFNAQKKVLQIIKTEDSLFFGFALKGDLSSWEDPICGGEVMTLMDANPEKSENVFHSLSQSFAQREPGILMSAINKISENKVSLTRYWIEKKEISKSSSEKYHSQLREDMNKCLLENRPHLIKTTEKIFPEQVGETHLFLEPLFPFPQLVIAGAGHIGQAVAHLGSLLQFEVTVIDDRPEFANKERIPDADYLIVDEIGKAIRNFPLSDDTYLVIVTPGHRHDAEALLECIHSDAAYIGMIGSRRKTKLMREKFLKESWATPQELDRIHAPIGIDIQSKTIEEIAISIAAQLVLIRNQNQKNMKEGK